MRGYNFTEDVRKLLATAREESVRLHHEYVGTEHILLACTNQENATAAQMLRRVGAQPAEIRATIEKTIRVGSAPAPWRSDLPYTSRAKKTLELAMTEADELRHSFIGTEHLLLGLLREEKGIAAQVLALHGVRADAVRAALLERNPPDDRRGGEEQSELVLTHVASAHRLRLSRSVVVVISVLWAALWVYLRPDILNWRLLALFLLIVTPPILLFRLTR